MAYDKVVDSAALDTQLTSIADAIRAKTGGTDTMTLDEMPTEIASIQTGGGGSYEKFGLVIDEYRNTYGAPTFFPRKVSFYANNNQIPDGYFSRNTDTSYSSMAGRIWLDLEEVAIYDASFIGYSAFLYCTNLQNVSLCEDITEIKDYAFANCSKLVLDTIPKNVNAIGKYAFRQCNAITAITFKGTPQYIDSKSFIYCSKLKTVNVPWAEGEVANAPWGATNATIHYNYTGE